MKVSNEDSDLPIILKSIDLEVLVGCQLKKNENVCMAVYYFPVESYGWIRRRKIRVLQVSNSFLKRLRKKKSHFPYTF